MVLTTFLLVLAAALVVLGMVGLVLPAIPGPPVMFLGFWLAAWAEGYAYVGWPTLAFLFCLTALAVALDFIAGALGAKKFGASGWAVGGATIGAIVGIFFGPIGLLLGPFVGAVTGELISGRPVDIASRAGIGATIGLIVGTAIKIGLGLTMLGVFVFARIV